METISHKQNDNEHVEICAQGEGYIYGAIIHSEDNDGEKHVKGSSIDLNGIDGCAKIRRTIIEAIQRNKGENGEPPLCVDDDK